MITGTKQLTEAEKPDRSGRVASENVKVEYVPSSRVDADIAAQSHAGKVRSENQDYFLAIRLERCLRTGLTNLPPGLVPESKDEIAYGMAVADGIGGMPAGWLASRLALQKLIDLVVNTPDWIMRMDRRKAAVVKRRMTQRFHKIDAELRERGAKDSELKGMGTTLTVAASLGTDLFLGHIGDSRAYLFRSEELRQLTRDDTLAQAMIEAGVAAPDDSAVHGLRRVLTASVGSSGRESDPQVDRLCLRHGDQVLLCTDGLTECVPPEMIALVLRDSKSVDEACRVLINRALSAGAEDNVTVVLARYYFRGIST